jgi:TolA-binding protein
MIPLISNRRPSLPMNFNNLSTRLREEPEWAVLIGLLVLLVGAGGTFYYYQYQQRIQSANQKFHRSLSLYSRATQSGNFKRAVSVMENYVRNHPDNYRTDKIHFFLGKLYLQQNKPINSIEQFKILISDFPNSLFLESARLHIGYANARRGNYSAALRAYRKLSSKSPDHPLATEAQWQRALLLWKQGKDDQASSILAKVISPKKENFWTDWAGRLKNRINAKS